MSGSINEYEYLIFEVNMSQPALTRWKQIGIKTGTKLFRKPPKRKVIDKSELKVKAQETMECILQNGKTRMSVNGLRDAENYFREIDGDTLKNPKKAGGWEYWGIIKDDKFVSIYEIWKGIDEETQLANIAKIEETAE